MGEQSPAVGQADNATEKDHTFDVRVVIEKEREYLRLRRLKALLEYTENGRAVEQIPQRALQELYEYELERIRISRDIQDKFERSREKEKALEWLRRLLSTLLQPMDKIKGSSFYGEHLTPRIEKIREFPFYKRHLGPRIDIQTISAELEDLNSYITELESSLQTVETQEKEILDDYPKLKAELDRPPVGLAFSGGGIRSATFNLGLVQSLSRFGILPWVDYLTSISGGGLAAACMISLLGRCAAFSTQWSRFPFNPGLKAFVAPKSEHEADEDLSSTDPVETMSDHNAQLAHLRNKGNYLIPRKGWVNRDTLRTVGAVLVGMVHTVGVFLLALLVLAAAHYAIVAAMSPAILGDIALPAPQASIETPQEGKVVYWPAKIVDDGADGPTLDLLMPVSTEPAGYEYNLKIVGLLFRDYRQPAEDGQRPVPWPPYLLAVGGGVLCSAVGFWSLVYFYCLWRKTHRFEPLRSLSRTLYRWFENRLATSARVTVTLEQETNCVECVSWLATLVGIAQDQIEVLSPRDSARRIVLRMPEAAALQLKLMQQSGRLDPSGDKGYKKVNVRLGSEKTRLGLTNQECIDAQILRLTSLLFLVLLVVSVIALRIQYNSREPGPQIFWIWLPTLFAFGNQLGLSILRFCRITYSGKWLDGQTSYRVSIWSQPRFRTVFWAWHGLGFYVTVALLVLAVLSLPHFFSIQRASGKAIPYATVVISAAWAAFLSYTGGKQDDGGNALSKLFTLSPALRNALLSTLVIVLNLSVIFLIQAGIDQLVQIDGSNFVASLPSSAIGQLAILIGAILLVGLLTRWIVRVNFNYITPHYWYRDRIADAYLKTEIHSPEKGVQLVRDESLLRLQQINPAGKSSPYHLIVTAVNLPGSWQLANKDRKAKPFILSRHYCGSDPTGYVRTEQYRDGQTKYSRALAVSAAAVSSSLGFQTFFAQAFMMTLLNVRLGLWMTNPREHDSAWKRFVCAVGRKGHWENAYSKHMEKLRYANVFWPTYLADESLGVTSERRPMVNLSDGGHTGDNAALYPLFQRRCQVIIAGDASQDPEGMCNDLFRVIRQVKVDLNIDVQIDVDGLRPAKYDKDKKMGQPSQYHCAVGTITYPAIYDAQGNLVEARQDGWLIYFKPAITDAVPDVIKQYWETHPAQFPHPTTVDQFFDEEQFESQRHLGAFTVQHTLNRLKTHYQHAVKAGGGQNKKAKAAIKARRRLVKAMLASQTGAVFEAILGDPSTTEAMIKDLQKATTIPSQ